MRASEHATHVAGLEGTETDGAAVVGRSALTRNHFAGQLGKLRTRRALCDDEAEQDVENDVEGAGGFRDTARQESAEAAG